MKMKKVWIMIMVSLFSLTVDAQVENAGGVRRRSEKETKEKNGGAAVTDRMQGFYQNKDTHEADVSYRKQVYRRIDLEKEGPNAALYYPEDVIDGQENLFRIILRLVLDGQIPAYEYLDGREIFTDQYRMKIPDLLNRFDLYAQPAKGSTEKNPKYVIEEADVPSNQVLNYYVIEKWEFDRRSNQMKMRVEAICPVLNRYGEYGGETRYPMFWVKFDSLRPHLTQQYVFISDDNNLPKYSLDDFFTLGLYDGEIYKTQNMRNLSLAQQFPDEDEMKHAQDSIDYHLRNYGKNLWVPTREEYLAMKEAQEEQKKAAKKAAPEERTVNLGDSTITVVALDDFEEEEVAPTVSSRAKKKSSSSSSSKKTNNKKPKASSSPSVGNASAEKSVRRRKR